MTSPTGAARASSPDVFTILGVERREDSYSSFLAEALRALPTLRRRFFERALGNVPVDLNLEVEDAIRLRRRTEAGIPDLMLRARHQGEAWVVFVEVKIDADEGEGQTDGYLAASRDVAGRRGRAGGLYLTVGGDQPACPDVVPLRFAEVGEWVRENLPLLKGEPLREVAEAFVARATAPLPCSDGARRFGVATGEAARRGTLWRDVDVLQVIGDRLASALGATWEAYALTLQGRGHAAPGLQLCRETWHGEGTIEEAWRDDAFDVHLEIGFDPDEAEWSLKVHCETRPYYTGKDLTNIKNIDAFWAFSKKFRAEVASRVAKLPRWRARGGTWQAAVARTGLSAESTVADVESALADVASEIAPVIDAALSRARAVHP